MLACAYMHVYIMPDVCCRRHAVHPAGHALREAEERAPVAPGPGDSAAQLTCARSVKRPGCMGAGGQKQHARHSKEGCADHVALCLQVEADLGCTLPANDVQIAGIPMDLVEFE